MKILTLDLAKQTGWAVATDSGSIISGHVKFDEVEFHDLALAFWLWLEKMIDTYDPEVIAYEAPVVKHPHATKILVGLSWLVIVSAALRGIKTRSVTNTQAKKHYVGRTYGKKEVPYPGIVEARKRGHSPRTTDESDALAILSFVSCDPCKCGNRATPVRRVAKGKRRGQSGRRKANA